MKIYRVLIIVICAALPPAARADEAEPICFENLPGEEGIPLGSPNQVRLEKAKLSDKGHIGYIATEYIEAANLQASVYVKIDDKYCLAGILGPMTDFHLDKFKKSNGRYDLVVGSKSGSTKFSRGFSFQKQKYILSWCTAVDSGSQVRPCTKSEMAGGF